MSFIELVVAGLGALVVFSAGTFRGVCMLAFLVGLAVIAVRTYDHPAARERPDMATSVRAGSAGRPPGWAEVGRSFEAYTSSYRALQALLHQKMTQQDQGQSSLRRM